MLPIFRIGHVGHNHIRPRKNPLLPSVVRKRLQRGRSGNIDIMQIEPGHGNHLQRKLEPLFRIRLRKLNGLPRRCLMMGQIRPHPDHVEIHVPEEGNVPRQIVYRLPWQPNHDPASSLIADPLQHLNTRFPAFITMIRRMQLRIQLGRGGLHPQQITMRASLPPTTVHRFRLLPETQRDTQPITKKMTHLVQKLFNVDSVVLGFNLPGLQDDRPIAMIKGPLRHPHNILCGQAITNHGLIALPDAAIETILGAVIPEFNQAAQAHPFADLPDFHLIGGLEQRGGLFQTQQRHHLVMTQLIRRSGCPLQKRNHKTSSLSHLAGVYFTLSCLSGQ